MSDTADIIVVGAGGGSLAAAAYLAKSGLDVLVLERNPWIGGGVITREVTQPGYKNDIHSTGHIFIQANPMIYKDELELQAKFGLEYIASPIFFSSVFPDGQVLKTYCNLDKSCESIAQFSRKDAEAYRKFVKKSEAMLPLFQMGLFNPPMPFGGFMAMLDQSPVGKTMIGDMMKSTYDLVLETFESEKVQMHFMRWASEAMMAPETRGTGAVLYLMCSFVHNYEAKFPKGGSGELSNALQRCIEHYNGRVMVNAPVKRAIIAGGRATGVELDDGRVFKARKAVVACVHPFLLNDFVGGGLDAGVQESIRKIAHADYSAMNTHYALHEAPKYKFDTEELKTSFAVETQPHTMEEFRLMFDAYRYNKVPEHISVLSICLSQFDKTRAPDGKHTLYLYTFMPNAVNGNVNNWAQLKDKVADRMFESLQAVTTNMTRDNLIGERHVDSPLEMARHSASFQNGDIGGAGLFIFQFMGRRPTPELANYNVPGYEGLYLVGPFMHPGGGVIGGGRPAAIKVMRDLKMKTDHLATR